jgi:hypothetical protein
VYRSSRMLKKSASGVLASLRGSTYRSIRLASLLAAALLDGLFEHPADYSGTIAIRIITAARRTKTEFSRKLLDGKSGSRQRGRPAHGQYLQHAACTITTAPVTQDPTAAVERNSSHWSYPPPHSPSGAARLSFTATARIERSTLLSVRMIPLSSLAISLGMGAD